MEMEFVFAETTVDLERRNISKSWEGTPTPQRLNKKKKKKLIWDTKMFEFSHEKRGTILRLKLPGSSVEKWVSLSYS